MREPRNVQVILAVSLVLTVSTTALAHHNDAPFFLREFALADPLDAVLYFEGTMSFFYDGYHCGCDLLRGEGIVVRPGHEPAAASIDGWASGVATTGLQSLSLYMGDGMSRDYSFTGPNLAMTGGPVADVTHAANATFHWGPLDYLGIHEGDPVCWDLIDHGC